MKKIFLVSILMILAVMSFSQIEPLSPWNRQLNPALISWSARNFIELSADLNSNLIQESLDLEGALKLNVLGNQGEYYDLTDSDILARKVDFGMYGKLKLGALVLAPEFSITNRDWHNNSTLDFRNSLWIDGGVHFGIKGDEFSFGGTVRSSLPIYDVVRRNNGSDYYLITAFSSEKYDLPYTYSLLIDGPMEIFNHMDALMDKLINNGILTLDIGFVAGKDFPAIGFGVKDIPLAYGVGIYKYDVFAEPVFSREYLEFSSFELKSATNEKEVFTEFKPWKMTFFITLPILLDFVPSIEYAPETEDFIWGVAAGKRMLWGILPFWAEIKNYNINTDFDSYSYWTFNGGIGLNIYLAEVHASLSTQAINPENLFNGRNTSVNVNLSVGF